MVPRLRRPLPLDRLDGQDRNLPRLRRPRPSPSRHRLVRRNALRDGSHRIRTHNADLFVSIGTSGAVYPAAGYVQTARYCGARTLELNLDPSQGSIFFDEVRVGPAATLVPAWVAELIA